MLPQEVNQLLALAPKTLTFSAVDFEVSRNTVMSGALSQYRLIFPCAPFEAAGVEGGLPRPSTVPPVADQRIKRLGRPTATDLTVEVLDWWSRGGSNP